MGNQWETTFHYMISSPWNAMGSFWKLDCVSLFDFEGYGISASQGHLLLEFSWRSDNDETLHDSNYMCSKQCHLSFLVAFSLCGGGSCMAHNRMFWHGKPMGNLWETYGKLKNRSAQFYLIFGCRSTSDYISSCFIQFTSSPPNC